MLLHIVKRDTEELELAIKKSKTGNINVKDQSIVSNLNI